MYVGQCGVPLENLCPPRHEPFNQQKKKKCFPSVSMSVGQCGVTLENHCPVSVPGVKPGWEGTGRIRPTTVQRPEVLEGSLAALNYIVSCISVLILILT